jgi:hypothetical protein
MNADRLLPAVALDCVKALIGLGYDAHHFGLCLSELRQRRAGAGLRLGLRPDELRDGRIRASHRRIGASHRRIGADLCVYQSVDFDAQLFALALPGAQQQAEEPLQAREALIGPRLLLDPAQAILGLQLFRLLKVLIEAVETLRERLDVIRDPVKSAVQFFVGHRLALFLRGCLIGG